MKSCKIDNDVLQNETCLSWWSVCIYVTALTDLYREQKTLNMNSHFSFCENNIREYLKFLQWRNAKHDHEQFADKSRDTLLNEYNEKKFEQIYHKLWAQEAVSSSEYHFYILMNILLNYYMLTYDKDWHAAKISNLFIFEFKREKFICYISLIFIIHADKQN